jgi:hypothetical protein
MGVRGFGGGIRTVITKFLDGVVGKLSINA